MSNLLELHCPLNWISTLFIGMEIIITILGEWYSVEHNSLNKIKIVIAVWLAELNCLCPFTWRDCLTSLHKLDFLPVYASELLPFFRLKKAFLLLKCQQVKNQLLNLLNSPDIYLRKKILFSTTPVPLRSPPSHNWLPLVSTNNENGCVIYYHNQTLHYDYYFCCELFLRNALECLF